MLRQKKYKYQKKCQLLSAAIERNKDAEILKNNKRYRGAIYLKGYQLECILKWRLLELSGKDTLEGFGEEIGKDLFQHNIELFISLIREKLKGIGGNAYPPEIAKAFKDFYNVWSSQERYCPLVTSSKEKETCDKFFHDADKIIAHFGLGGQ